MSYIAFLLTLFLENDHNSISIPSFIIVKAYIPTSYINVDIITINIIVNLLSFEKFLSQYSAINPIAPSNIPEIPIDLPISKSINIPKKLTLILILSSCLQIILQII